MPLKFQSLSSTRKKSFNLGASFALNSLVLLISLVGFAGNFGLSMITCSSSNGRGPDSVDNEVKSVELLIEEKRRAELSARISSGEFTVNKSGYELWLQFCFCWVIC